MFILYRVLDYCRVGSLEIDKMRTEFFQPDYCRVGSLEKTCNGARL